MDVSRAWLPVTLLIAAVGAASACGDEGAPATPSAGVDGGDIDPSGKPTPEPEQDSGPPAPSTIATEPNLKIAFIGDTAAGDNFKSVLALIEREKATAILIQGDLTYSGTTSAQWFSAIDETTKLPYFVAQGNHDVGWDKLGGGLQERYAKLGIPMEHNDPTLSNYAFVYKGLKVVMVGPGETDAPTRADYVKERLKGDPHIWKICSWHKNQRASNVADKDDEMGWQIYENCRAQGAIVAQGHSHTYSRSKTLINDTAQIVDENCNDPFSLCVGPGRHFFFDSSLGGVDTRGLNTTWSAKPHFASAYSGAFGALFIEFNVDGDARKARGYFKTVGDQRIDPPEISGKKTFTITREL
jgi:hypothetical protein